MFPTELERPLFIISSIHISNLELSSTRIYPCISKSFKNFVDPDSGAHTNTIEGVWALAKKKLKWMCCTLYEYVPSYLDEFTWFRNFGKDRAFEQLLKDIAERFLL